MSTNRHQSYQPDPEEIGVTLNRLAELRKQLNDTITDLQHIHQTGGTPDDYRKAKEVITKRIETITAEMTLIRTWLEREGVLRGGER